MAASTCISSKLMSELLAWRNPQGREERFTHGSYVDNPKRFALKISITEVVLFGLCISSTVETIAYAALNAVAMIFYPLTSRPYTFFAKQLQSSSFTILWAVADILIYNPFSIGNIMTRESFARHWAERVNRTSILLFREEDLLFIHDWCVRHNIQNVADPFLAPIVNRVDLFGKVLKEGAEFINVSILKNEDMESRSKFEESDASIFMYILSKALFIYAFGDLSKAAIPAFFREETKIKIEALRKNFTNVISQELNALFNNLTSFEKELVNSQDREILNRLRAIATEELSGLLVTRCFSKAWETFPWKNTNGTDSSST